MNTSETSTSRSTPGLLGAYRTLLSAPGGGRLAAASLVSKLPINMFSVSAVLLLSPRYSYAASGLAVSVMLVANAVSSPIRGRLADRHRVPVVLIVCLLGYLAGAVGLMAAAGQRLSLWIVVASVTLLGLCFPPVSILLRGYWVAAAGERARTSANSFESALMDITLITGPVLATWLSTATSPIAPFIATSVLMAVAVVLMCAVREVPRTARPEVADWRGPLRSGPLRRVLAALFLFCAALSVVEVVLPIYAQQHDVTGYSGWFLAGLSVGSIVGALGLGAVSTPPRWLLPALLGVFAAGALLLAFAMTVNPILVLVVCPLTGVTIGASFTHLYTAVGTTGPEGSGHEAQGWATSCSTVGFALGAAGGAGVAGTLGAAAFVLMTPITALAAGLLMLGGARSAQHTGREYKEPVGDQL
ncbi:MULTISPECIES: MFS transporter [Streptomyces]|uniref:MFS transporter n=1 Tax=Streptomyces TaxID=1883 RepID=UPI000879DA55|nr:putative MFS family arabinose efflux permease [Streptomyces sp. 2221.1]SDT79904.1 Predicted arabinose efflux permease, MFS family [Streptomyces sp. 2114.2]